ncbi:hypothetical protein FF38_09164 [Lucilia cuprina]|uniref:Uncharacterized protein n=1 Tax=Lucilia cuprina TaxID=7375 RepID=A0A0L0CQN4_LUCCU|nr:hypothetical protein FF38_09164 [Lucilia cuprina]
MIVIQRYKNQVTIELLLLIRCSFVSVNATAAAAAAANFADVGDAFLDAAAIVGLYSETFETETNIPSSNNNNNHPTNHSSIHFFIVSSITYASLLLNLTPSSSSSLLSSSVVSNARESIYQIQLLLTQLMVFERIRMGPGSSVNRCSTELDPIAAQPTNF